MFNMAVDVTRQALPSGPVSLCFDKDEFMKENFNVELFVLECKKRVPLETLRDDLATYLKVLQSAMIELINKDYADFVNLSTNLVGMDKAIGSLTEPLGQLRDEVLVVRSAMDAATEAVQEKLKYKQYIKEKRTCLQRLINIGQSVEKIEKLLQIQHMDTGQEITARSCLSGQLIERVATEFNKLQFYVSKSKGLPLVENIKPRISSITTTLQHSLEGSFLDGLEHGNTEILQQCLRTYALIDKIKDAEHLFRENVVKPYMEQIITEEFLMCQEDGLLGMYTNVLAFIPANCTLLNTVTAGGKHGDAIRGYDFMVNSIWPEIVKCIEARTPSIFAPGNPDIFYQKYLISMEFLDQFERFCGSQTSVKRLREHPSYSTFMAKWSLPVYFQIRFQEIAGGFESAIFTAFNKADSSDGFHLLVTSTLYRSLEACWYDGIYLSPLCHRFWKLTLQLLSRYASFLDDAYTEQIVNRNHISEMSNKNTRPLHTVASESSITDVSATGGGTNWLDAPMVRSATSAKLIDATQAGSNESLPDSTHPPVTMGQVVCLVLDAESITTKVQDLFDISIKRRVDALGLISTNSLKECLLESQQIIVDKLPKYCQYIISDIFNQCSVYLKQVNDIPRLFRRTNREVPHKPSTYVSNLFRPLQLFLDEHSGLLNPKKQSEWSQTVLLQLAQQYYTMTCDVLTSIKKMEDSLKRLKRARGTDTNTGTSGLSDDDKIRLQLILDIESYISQVKTYNIDTSSMEDFQKLLELVDSARGSMNST